MSTRGEAVMPNDQDYWEEVYRQAPLETIRKCEDAARQLISLNSLLSAIYFGVISFNDVLLTGITKPWMLAAFMPPIILWCMGLFFAMRVLIPGPQPVENDIRRSYKNSGDRKYRLLRHSYYALLCSMIALIIAVGIYIWLLLPPATETAVPLTP
jgi:hypothetical protein